MCPQVELLDVERQMEEELVDEFKQVERVIATRTDAVEGDQRFLVKVRRRARSRRASLIAKSAIAACGLCGPWGDTLLALDLCCELCCVHCLNPISVDGKVPIKFCGLQWRGLPYGECTWEKYDDILKAGGPENVQQLKVSNPALSCCACLACTDIAMTLCAALSRNPNLCIPANPAHISAPPISRYWYLPSCL